MKKETFLDLVCERLSELSLDAREIEKQRAHIDKYLSNLGIEDESEELDDEDPNEFAEDIYEVMLENGVVTEKSEDEAEDGDAEPDEPAEPAETVKTAEQAEDRDDDIIVTAPPKKSGNDFVEAETRTDIAIPRHDFRVSGATAENTDDASDSEPPYTDEELEEFYESEGLSDEDLGGSPDEIVAEAKKEADEDATREFGVSDIELEASQPRVDCTFRRCPCACCGLLYAYFHFQGSLYAAYRRVCSRRKCRHVGGSVLRDNAYCGEEHIRRTA